MESKITQYIYLDKLTDAVAAVAHGFEGVENLAYYGDGAGTVWSMGLLARGRDATAWRIPLTEHNRILMSYFLQQATIGVKSNG